MIRRRAVIGAAVAAAVGLGAAQPAAAQDNPALDWSSYEKTILAPPGATSNGGPLDLAVFPDKRVLFTNRNGLLRLYDPATGVTRTVNTFSVFVGPEEGLQTVSLDPNFKTNKYVYIYYSPQWQRNTAGNPTNASPPGMSGADPDGIPYPEQQPSGNAPTTLPAGQDESYWLQWRGYNLLSRFTWDEATESLDMASEQPIIKIHAQRGQCCHLGTDVAFDSKGNLYLSTGDNVPAGGLGGGGYGVFNDDTPGANPGMDARRSSGNTNDLRGKILRIKVKDVIAPGTAPGLGTTYDAVEGNLRDYVRERYPQLVTPDYDQKFRPEIYIMGLRNPFRIDIDPVTDELTWGDYGPDAGNPNANRGPMGKVEWTVATKPHNGGWPFCTSSNSMTDDPFDTGDGPFGHAYSDWDHVNLVVKGWFDCQNLVNDSKWNTGLANLPPAVAPSAYYGDRITDTKWPEFFNYKDTGRNFQAPMGGPKYRFDASNPSLTKFPKHWDGKWFFYEFDNRFISAMTVGEPNADGVRPLISGENVLPNATLRAQGKRPWTNVIDIEFGPEGSLYTIEYGSGGNNDTALVRTDYKASFVQADGDVGGSVPATLSLSLGGAASFGPFTPGVANEYLASTTANVISSAGDAQLTVADPSATATGHLVNGAFALPRPLVAAASNGANPSVTYKPVGSSASPTSLLTWDAPVSNDAVTLAFSQSIDATDALRTGTYGKTLTFTLSTTTP